MKEKTNPVKTLHLTLKKKWFDMILSGEKKEEYREIKPYWFNRLQYPFSEKYRPYTHVKFKNGYSKSAPEMIVECLGIEKGKCKADWSYGAIEDHFVIKLGKILETKNLVKTDQL